MRNISPAELSPDKWIINLALLDLYNDYLRFSRSSWSDFYFVLVIKKPWTDHFNHLNFSNGMELWITIGLRVIVHMPVIGPGFIVFNLFFSCKAPDQYSLTAVN